MSLQVNPGKEFVDFIQRTIEQRKATDPKYSLRALAIELDVNSGILSSILAGSRKLTYETAASWLKKLCADKHEQHVLLTKMNESADFHVLSGPEVKKLTMLAQAVLTVLRVRQNSVSVQKTAEILEKSETEIANCVADLQRLNLVRQEGGLIHLLVQKPVKGLFDKEVYNSLLSESIEHIQGATSRNGYRLSHTMTMVSSTDYVNANLHKYLKSAEALRNDLECKTGDTLFQGVFFLAPVGKSILD